MNPSLLLDANVLTLWIVGNVSPNLISDCKRTKKYSSFDFSILAGHLARFQNITTIPQVMAETSNLIGVLGGKHLVRARSLLASFATTWEESYVESAKAAGLNDYARLGLTDAAIVLASSAPVEVLTDDFDLYMVMEKKKLKVTNFTHLRLLG